MGEYFSWVNIDKKEYFSPCDFGMGNKLYENLNVWNPFLCALYSIIATDWKGDNIIFFGDQSNVSEKESNPILRRFMNERKQWKMPGYDFDYVFDQYRCISAQFADTQKVIRTEIEEMIASRNFSINAYGINPQKPYEGVFVRKPDYYQFTINHTKNEFFDVEKTKLAYKNIEGVYTTRMNPLPILLAFSETQNEAYQGLWIGDSIEVSENVPSSKYRDVSEEYGWEH